MYRCVIEDVYIIFLIRYVRHKTALKKSVFVRRVHLELLPLTKTDVRTCHNENMDEEIQRESHQVILFL